jgi:hypothetical protein
MTAISGAIRVQGGGLFKAVIGRARENHAAAEIEYMSSTSTEVCELYNGKGIVRTMGKPYIAQLIISSNCSGQENKDPDSTNQAGGRGIREDEPAEHDGEDSYGIHTLETAKEKGFMDFEGKVHSAHHS